LNRFKLWREPTISPVNTETSALFFDMKPLRMEVILDARRAPGVSACSLVCSCSARFLSQGNVERSRDSEYPERRVVCRLLRWFALWLRFLDHLTSPRRAPTRGATPAIESTGLYCSIDENSVDGCNNTIRRSRSLRFYQVICPICRVWWITVEWFGLDDSYPNQKTAQSLIGIARTHKHFRSSSCQATLSVANSAMDFCALTHQVHDITFKWVG
jgi:hypothetical protein